MSSVIAVAPLFPSPAANSLSQTIPRLYRQQMQKSFLQFSNKNYFLQILHYSINNKQAIRHCNHFIIAI
jgi:hypothetical protein